MNWIRNKQQWRDYLLITLGTAVMAVATSSIYDPAGLVTGGFSGLAIVIKQLSQMLFGKGVPLWVTNLVLNIPLFLFGIRMSRDFLVKTIFGTLMNTFWIAVLPVLQLVPDDRMLSALFGGRSDGSRHRPRLHRKRYDGRNGYDGGSDPEKAAPLFRCTGYAGA